MSYTLTQKEFVNLKRRLTTCENKFKKATSDDTKLNAAKALKRECERALNIFQEKGFPDAWARWERLKEDMEFQIHRYSQPAGIYSR